MFYKIVQNSTTSFICKYFIQIASDFTDFILKNSLRVNRFETMYIVIVLIWKLY